MRLIPQTPKKALKAFLKQRPSEIERDKFKSNLISLLDKISIIEKHPKDESEEHLKNNLRDFLRDTFYIGNNAINTKDKKDLVIHIGKTTDTDVAVIIEAKRPTNVNEMVSATNPNKKAFHELILYYLNERNVKSDVQLKQLVVTNINEWFIIDANSFDKYIYRNTPIKKLYETKLNDKKDNPWFYEEISKIVAKIDAEIPCVYFDIRDYEKILRNTKTENDKELVALYKILSPQHLLKIASPNDSNTLNERFYKELLHIIGLEEAREGTKNIIRRKKENRNTASLIELSIEALKTEDTFHRIHDIKIYGENKEEQTFNIALELCITWINRILFLKLLEGQLISYHQGNKGYRFLNSETIHDYDELFKLFHKVLAVNIRDRTEVIRNKYTGVPYLNSSLFEISELEDQTIKINSLENNGQLELINTTILRDIKKEVDKLPSLNYLFNFLDAYDFASEGTEDWQKDNRQLINASVLGKVFEKINGYRDGSIFTPAFITMYMCRKSIRLAVVEKFNEALSDKDEKLFDKFDDVKNYTGRHFKTGDILKANEIIDSLHICDPAVGSGHFLVSALNEIIAIKAELGILADEKGNNITGYEIEIVNDELIITDQQGNNVEYKIQNGKPVNKEIQRLQKTLFYQKQNIIENCLFGVDINPKSVLICRLRLWIELLKNAFYKEAEFTELETLPNIDINIKCGNSLLSRFDLDADLSKALKSIKYDIKAYRGFVNDYKNEKSRDVKRGLQKIIDTIKGDFRTEIGRNDPKQIKLSKLSGDLYNLLNQGKLFELDSKQKKQQQERQQSLEADIDKLAKEIEEIKSNAIYKNAFEWRFEFPEVLSNEGEFEGFDVIIANPPYVFARENFTPAMKDYFISNYKASQYQVNLFLLFIERAIPLLKNKGQYSLIIPNSLLMVSSAQRLRKHLLEETALHEIINLMGNTFEGINVETIIISGKRENKDHTNKIAVYINEGTEFILSHSKEQNLFMQNEGTELTVFSNNASDELTVKLRSGSVILDNLVKIKAGLQAYEKGKGIPKQTDEDVKSRPYDYNFKFDKNTYEYLEGKDVCRYQLKWSGTFLKYGENLAAPRTFNIFNGKKIIIREITGKYPQSIIATYSEDIFLFNRSNIAIVENAKSTVSLKYILAILNSKLLSHYFVNNTAKSVRRLFPKLILEDLRKFPIKEIGSKEQEPFIELVDKIILLKQQGEDSNDFEKKIDELVYELYDITPDEQKIIEGQ